MSRSFNLYRLQQVDTQLQRSRSRLAEIDALLAEDSALRAARQAKEKADVTFETARKALRAAEEATRAQRIKIEQTENHLYSGKVTHPKELQDLQQEIAAHRRHLETLEERQIEAMLNFEDAEADAEAARTAVDETAARKVEADSALKGEQSRLREEVGRLDSERGVALIPVAAEDREIYSRLAAKRAGVAVAEATGGSCSACGTSLNAALYQAARSPSRLVFCETCGRVLYAG